jgi:hypothetical protein
LGKVLARFTSSQTIGAPITDANISHDHPLLM